MAKWIIEADINRCRKELADLSEQPKRKLLLDCLSVAEAMHAHYEIDERVLESSNA